MSKRLILVMVGIVFALSAGVAFAWGFEGDYQAVTLSEEGTDSTGHGSDRVQVESERVGIGGGGALFYPTISPHDGNEMTIGTDMGDVYVSHDAGASWHKKSTGQMYAATYDPTDANRVYVGGYGVWRSTDKGDTFQRLWPSHITGEWTQYESFGYLLANTDGYMPVSTVRSIAVDPADSAHIFVLVLYDATLQVFESVDDGATFSPLASRAESRHGLSSWDDHTKVVVSDGEAWLCTEDGIFACNRSSATFDAVYVPDGVTHHYLIDVDQVDSDGANGVAEGTYYWVAESLSASASPAKTSLRRLQVKLDGSLVWEDLTDDMNDPANGLNRADRSNPTRSVEVRIRELAGATATRVYFYTPTTSSDGCVLGRYDASRESAFSWVYGYRLNDDVSYNYCLTNPSHADSYYKMWGIATSPTEPNRFLLATGFGAYGSSDCEVAKQPSFRVDYPKNSNVSQLYANRLASDTVKLNYYEKYTFASTGLDNVTTYGLRVDPFDENHVALLNTDFGLTLSNDAGASWSRANVAGGIPNSYAATIDDPSWTNTVYDFAFDRYVKGRAYSLWAGRHDAPYTVQENDLTKWQGGFAAADISGDAWSKLDVAWSAKGDGSALPANSIPVKMDIVYPADASVENPGGDRTIWVACYNDGFFKSTDSGATFAAVNGGLTVESGAVDGKGAIYAADVEASEDGSRVFGILARRAGGDNEVGQVVQLSLDGQTWEKIDLPAGVTCPRDLTWDEGSQTLYISCCADNVYLRTAVNADYSLPLRQNVGGGLYLWHPGDQMAAALDASSAVVGEAASIEGTCIDGAGNLFASDVRGNVWLRPSGEQGFEQLYERFHASAKDVQLVSESVEGAVRTDELCLPSFGGGMLRLEVEIPEEVQHVSADVGEVDDVLLNPGKGWTAYGPQTGRMVDWGRYDKDTPEDSDYAGKTGIGYWRWDWSEIEPEPGVYNWKPIDDAIADFWSKGKQFAFGVMAANTSSEREYVTPKWVFDSGAAGETFSNSGYDGTDRNQVFPVWTDEVFLRYSDRFVAELGKRYNGDPRVAFVDIRSYGNWGEQHLYGINDTPEDGWQWILSHNVTSEFLRDRYIKPYMAAFPDTQLVNVWGLAQYDDTYEWAIGQGVSIRRDGVMYHSDGHECAMAEGALPAVYEYSWNYWYWKNRLYTDKWTTEDEWKAWFTEELTREVNIGKPSYMQLDFDMYYENPEFCDWLANYMGYWLRLTHAEFDTSMVAGARNEVSFAFRNDGVAPLFRPNASFIALLDSAGNVVAKQGTDWDAFDWKPGQIEEESASVTFEGVAPGSYQLAYGLFENETDDGPTYLLGSAGVTEDKWYVLGDVRIVEASAGGEDDGSGDEGSGSDDGGSGEGDAARYAIVLNPDGVWSGSVDGHAFSSDADFAKFVCVLVDDEVLDRSCYDAQSGSTKVTLHADYLETLPAGVHTAVIRSTDGEASTTFTVQAHGSQDDAGDVLVDEPAPGGSVGGGASGSGDVPDASENSDVSGVSAHDADGSPEGVGGGQSAGSKNSAKATNLGAAPKTGDVFGLISVWAAVAACASAVVVLLAVGAERAGRRRE